MEELLHSKNLPLSNDPKRRAVQEKLLAGAKLEDLSVGERFALGGRDQTITEINGYDFKPDHAYRVVDKETYEYYKKMGAIVDDRRTEFVEGENNQGIDWYLGGASLRYGKGEVVLEMPAYKKYFQLSGDNGCGMSADPNVRHIKSSPKENAVPFDLVRLIKHPDMEIDLSEEGEKKIERVLKSELEASGYYDDKKAEQENLKQIIKNYQTSKETEHPENVTDKIKE